MSRLNQRKQRRSRPQEVARIRRAAILQMSFSKLNRTPHKRFNPLLREWVLVSPHRTQRPWLGRVEKTQTPPALSFDPNCYLRPGNRRAGRAQTPTHSGIYVFVTD